MYIGNPFQFHTELPSSYVPGRFQDSIDLNMINQQLREFGCALASTINCMHTGQWTKRDLKHFHRRLHQYFQWDLRTKGDVLQAWQLISDLFLDLYESSEGNYDMIRIGNLAHNLHVAFRNVHITESHDWEIRIAVQNLRIS